MPRLRHRLVALVALPALGLTPTAFADHGEPDDVRWMVLRAPSGVCLDGATSKVRALACTGEVGQVWSFQGDHLVAGDGRCLSVAPREAGLDGARLLVAACAERDDQRFERRGRAIVDGHGLCLEARESRRGSVVQTWECTSDADGQRWAAMAPESFAVEEEAEPELGQPLDELAPEPGPSYVPYEPAVVVNGPAVIHVTPAPAPVVVAPAPVFVAPPVDPIGEAFRFVDHTIHTFRSFVDAFAPGSFGGFGGRW